MKAKELQMRLEKTMEKAESVESSGEGTSASSSSISAPLPDQNRESTLKPPPVLEPPVIRREEDKVVEYKVGQSHVSDDKKPE